MQPTHAAELVNRLTGGPRTLLEQGVQPASTCDLKTLVGFLRWTTGDGIRCSRVTCFAQAELSLRLAYKIRTPKLRKNGTSGQCQRCARVTASELLYKPDKIAYNL